MITLALLKAAIKTADPSDTSEDAYLTALEAAAVAALERWTGRYYGPVAARTEYLSGTGAQEIWLAETPTTAVTVTSDGTAVDAGDFELRGRRLRHDSAWGSEYYPTDLVLTYSAGYAAGAEPADIRQAVLQLVTLWYEERLPLGEIPDEAPFSVRAIIDANRRYTV